MRTVTYRQYEPHPGWSDPISAPLTTFIYDVPYLLCWGILPPRHLLNELLLEGGSAGGMSPGADWKPFEISEGEYRELCLALESVDPLTLFDKARCFWNKARRVPELDEYTDYLKWGKAVTERFKEDARLEQERNLARMQDGT